MQVFVGERGSGKTTELIKIASAEFLYIVCQSREQALEISRQANEMGLAIPFPITFGEFLLKRFYGKNIKGFLIDNADSLLQCLAGRVPVKAVSLTNDLSV